MKKGKFEMYAIYINEPYIVEEKDIPAFWKNSSKKNGLAAELCKKFKDEWFEFSLDENGYMSGVIEIEEVDGEEENDD